MRDPKKALRILFVEQAVGFGGSLVVISHLLKCLQETEFATVVVGEMNEEVLRYHIGDRAKLEIVRHPLNYVHQARFSRILRKGKSETLYRAGMYFFTLVSAISNLIYAFRLGIVIVRHKIDVVHINQPDNTEAILTSVALKRKVVVQAHGMGHVGLTHRLTLRAVEHFVAISDHVKKFLLSNRIRENRISVVPNPTIIKPTSAEKIDMVKQEYGITPEQKTFGIFGRLVSWKGHREFLAAASIVLANDQNARAFIVGDASDGPDRFVSNLKKVVRESGFSDRISFTGHILEVERLYAVMDVVVHASIEPEPFGLVITEAMAHGVPVVASNLGATQEIITHGYDGLLVDPTRPKEMASAILGLLQDEALRKTMGARARETVERKYNGDVYARRMGEVYRTVVGLA